MNQTITAQDTVNPADQPGPWLDRFARRATLDKLRMLQRGRLIIVEGDSRLVFGNEDPAALEATIFVRDPSFYSSIALGGSIGAAESYVRGEWSASDLTTAIRILVLNPQLGDDLDRGVARLKEPLRHLLHRLRDNTRSGSRRNIAAHYDLSNEFFAQFLDQTMTYSCGFFEAPDSTLEEASTAKYDRICRKLELGRDDEVLEIGCGWGGFAIHAASRYGCRVTATTISEKQYELASRRVREVGLEERIEIVRCDYRDLSERLDRRFDKVVSIEMIEAVGHRFLDTYFEICGRMLRPSGRMALQAITIADQRYERYRRSVDFIQRYIFPGGLVPSIAAMSGSIARASDLCVVGLEDIGSHYARTLSIWRRRFFDSAERIRELGYSDEFLKLWEFYFCYCEGGFMERTISTVQLLLAKPGFRPGPVGAGGVS